MYCRSPPMGSGPMLAPSRALEFKLILERRSCGTPFVLPLIAANRFWENDYGRRLVLLWNCPLPSQ